MISPSLDTLRTFMHVLSVCVWVGGQITLAALVPVLRRSSPESLPVVARAFARIAWPAMAVAVGTGTWGLMVVDPSAQSGEWMVTFALKMALVGVSVASTVAHSNARSKVVIAVGGAMGLLGALAAMACGILIAHGA